jgi:hypothetical protein
MSVTNHGDIQELKREAKRLLRKKNISKESAARLQEALTEIHEIAANHLNAAKVEITFFKSNGTNATQETATP